MGSTDLRQPTEPITEPITGPIQESREETNSPGPLDQTDSRSRVRGMRDEATDTDTYPVDQDESGLTLPPPLASLDDTLSETIPTRKMGATRRAWHVLKEIAVLFVALAVAGSIMYAFVSSRSGQPTYVTMQGSIQRLPLDVSSPIYGQIVSMPAQQGMKVQKGQALAIIQGLGPQTAPITQKSTLFRTLPGGRIEVLSPSDGLVGKVDLANGSMVAAASTFLQLYTIQATQLSVRLPADRSVGDYQGFAVAFSAHGRRYPITLTRPLPGDSASSSSSASTMMSARFTDDGVPEEILSGSRVIVFAHEKPKDGGLSLPSIPELLSRIGALFAGH
jgi:hypothetical protein